MRPHATLDGLPDIVANMPAVIALKMADPDAYGKFVKRFTAVYHDNEPDDVILTQARTAVRKSIKHLLANATNESLLEVTEVNLAYMRGLAQSNAGSCVALSDESKGAVLDANLARDFPPLFEREMAVLERVIGNAGTKQAAPTEAEVRPYLEAVFADLKKKPVQTQLLGRDKLTRGGIRALLRSRHRLLRRGARASLQRCRQAPAQPLRRRGRRPGQVVGHYPDHSSALAPASA